MQLNGMTQQGQSLFTELMMNLRDAAYQNSKAHGFWDSLEPNSAVLAMKIALCHSELSEALEEVRSPHKDFVLNQTRWESFDIGIHSVWRKKPDHVDAKPCGLPSELADCIIRILDICGRMNIDIGQAIIEKMKYNETRPHKHGGKTC